MKYEQEIRDLQATAKRASEPNTPNGITLLTQAFSELVEIVSEIQRELTELQIKNEDLENKQAMAIMDLETE